MLAQGRDLANPSTAWSPSGAPLARRWVALLFAFVTASGLLRFAYMSLSDLADREHTVLLARFIDEMTSPYCAASLFVLLLPFVRK
jgi:hypothetical protein